MLQLNSLGNEIDQDHDKHPTVKRVLLLRQVSALVLSFPDAFPFFEVRAVVESDICEFSFAQVPSHCPKISLVLWVD